MTVELTHVIDVDHALVAALLQNAGIVDENVNIVLWDPITLSKFSADLVY